MLIWSRLGILALLLPVPFIPVAEAVMVPKRTPAPKPPPKSEDEAEDARTPEQIEEERLAEKLKREVAHQKAVEKAKGKAYGVALIAGAVVLWPLGRWMNRTETQHLLDPATGAPVEVQSGGGHTLFFIPMEYWALFWAVGGAFKLLA
jgi:outer membrane biosynthesis protein TonB